MGEAKRRARAAASWLGNLSRLHAAEEKLRGESIAFVEGQLALRHHIAMTECAMNGLVYFATVIEGRNKDDETIQLLSLRLFNAAASALKLALSGYGQNAAAAIRDILEVAFLLNCFASWPDKSANGETPLIVTARRTFRRPPFGMRSTSEMVSLSRCAGRPTTTSAALLLTRHLSALRSSARVEPVPRDMDRS